MQVFSACPASDMSEKFWDVVAFCQQVSRLMVTEIRKRASNQSTEAASIAIVKFLEIETTEETSSGWMLLSTLNLLANGDVSLIQVSSMARGWEGRRTICAQNKFLHIHMPSTV